MSKGWGGRRAQRLVAACLDEYGTVCHLCGRPGATTADHVIPRSRGGSDSLDNLRPAHLSCNSARGNRPMSPAQPAALSDGLSFFKSDPRDAPRSTPRSFSRNTTKTDEIPMIVTD